MHGLLVSENERSVQILYVFPYYILHEDFQIGLNVFSNLCLLLHRIGHACYNNPRLILTPALYLVSALLIVYDVDLVESMVTFCLKEMGHFYIELRLIPFGVWVLCVPSTLKLVF